MPTTETFGPFDVAEPIGEGGMGVVYRAIHATTGTEAAVKVLTADYTARDRYRRAFRREAQALAKLNHPGIASILDFGTLDESFETGRGRLAAGTPWLAMEFVDGPPLGAAVDSWQWPQVEDFILTLLDALAHAHAHDVVHRDIKPSNILVAGADTEAASAVKLVDFGIAQLREDAEETERSDRIQGTPKYMAPEQIERRARDQGPWTDLYSLGCLLWRLLCGQAPFTAETTREVLQRHLSNRPETFDPLIDVPDGLHDWLRRMLVKDPSRRFRRAADAAWSLVQLTRPTSANPQLATTTKLAAIGPEDAPGAESSTSLSAGLEISDRATTRATPSSRTLELSDPLDDELTDAPLDQIAETLSVTPQPPPLPDDWRRRDSLDAQRPLPGGGLELFGLRTIPLVAREAERDLLWRELASVRRTDSPRMVILRGPAGSGKSRLVEWLAGRVRELGAAQVMKAIHTPNETARGGIGPMFGRHFEYLGMTWTKAFDRLQQALERLGLPQETIIHDAAGLLELVDLARESSRDVAGFGSRREAGITMRRILRHIAAERPLILWFDDIFWSSRTLALAKFLLDEPPDGSFPVLLIGTSRREALEANPEGEATLRESDGSVTWMNVPPLDRANLTTLIEQTLQLDDTLVDEIVERTEGTPMFAIQLLGEWVDQGLLEQGPSGFRLTDTSRATIPDDLQQLWSRRLAALLDPLGVDARAAVELAAALGKQVDPREWRACCDWLGLEVPDRLAERLIEAGLADSTADGWAFVHNMFVESLQREAARADRLCDYHWTIAQTLEELYPGQLNQTARRRGEHFRRAGEPRAALEPLRRAGLRLKIIGETGELLELLDRRDGLIDELGLGPEDRRRLQSDILRASAYNRLGRAGRARALLDRAEPLARGEAWHRELGNILLERARMRADSGRHRQALEAADAAREHHQRSGSTQGLARAELARGNILARQGIYPEASSAYDRAVTLFDEIGDTAYKIGSLQAKASVWVSQGRFEDVWQIQPRLRERARQAGSRHQEGLLWNTAGEVARYQGRWDQARHSYLKGRAIQVELESRLVHLTDMNLAMVDLGDRQFEQARQRFTEVEAHLTENNFQSRLGRVYLGLAGCAAGLNNWQLWERAVDRVERQLEETEDRHKDDPWLADIAAGYAAEEGQDERARRMYRIARDLWAQLDEPQRAEEVDGRIAALDSPSPTDC
mgnify:CR=1 FL=1